MMSGQINKSGNAEVTQFPMNSHKKNCNWFFFCSSGQGFKLSFGGGVLFGWVVGCFGFFSLWLSSTVSKLTEKLGDIGQT